MAISLEENQKFANAIWSWVGEKMDDTLWSSRVSDYDNWWDYYRGRQWEQESKEYQQSFVWKPVYNELGTALEEHVAMMMNARLRHYHINIDPEIKEMIALNAFLARATTVNMHYMRQDAALFGAIYGAAVMTFTIDPNAMPIGYIGRTPDDRVLPMMRYSAEPPWQWIFDPAGDGMWQDSHWAIRFFPASRWQAQNMAGRDIADASMNQWQLKNRFKGRTVASHNIQASEQSSSMEQMLIGAELWIRETPIYKTVEAQSRWRYIRVIGDWTVWGNHTEDDSRLDAPLGQETGIPAAIYSPRPMPKHIYGQSFVQRAMAIQKDINARRARAREIEQSHAGVYIVKGGNQGDADQVRNQRGAGVISMKAGVSIERLRGEKVDSAMYMEVRASVLEFQKLLGVPMAAMGQSQTGVYSGEHAQLLQQAANVMLGWRTNEFAMALKQLGNKEWPALKYAWGNKQFTVDTGSRMAIIDKRIMGIPGWVAEVVPEDMYSTMINSENEQVVQLFLQGLIDPTTFYQHLPFLDEDEKERSLQFTEARMAAAMAEPAGAGAAGATTTQPAARR